MSKAYSVDSEDFSFASGEAIGFEGSSLALDILIR